MALYHILMVHKVYFCYLHMYIVHRYAETQKPKIHKKVPHDWFIFSEDLEKLNVYIGGGIKQANDQAVSNAAKVSIIKTQKSTSCFDK